MPRAEKVSSGEYVCLFPPGTWDVTSLEAPEVNVSASGFPNSVCALTPHSPVAASCGYTLPGDDGYSPPHTHPHSPPSCVLRERLEEERNRKRKLVKSRPTLEENKPFRGNGRFIFEGRVYLKLIYIL